MLAKPVRPCVLPQIETAVYTLRKIGGKGKGGCWYTESQLVAVN